MRFTRRIAAATIVAAVLGAGLMTLAGPASAMSPCSGPTPPDWCFDPPAAPAAPTPITATSVLVTSVSMTWTNHSAVGARYAVDRTVNGVTTNLTHSATTGWTDNAAPAGTPISYQVYTTACNDNGCTEGARATLNVTTHPAGASPVGSAFGGTEACLYNCPNFPGYFYIQGSALDFDTTAPIQVKVIADGVPTGTVLTASAADYSNNSYPGYGNNHGFSARWQAKSAVKGTHQVCAIALNVAGGADSNIGCFSYVTPGKPNAASNLAATAGPTSVAVAFTDNADDETGFYLQRSTDSGVTWYQVGSKYAAVPGSGSRGTVVDNSTVASGTCYRILMENTYGQTASSSACTG